MSEVEIVAAAEAAGLGFVFGARVPARLNTNYLCVYIWLIWCGALPHSEQIRRSVSL